MELANSNFRNEPTSNDFSDASGCGLPPIGSPTKVITGTRRECKKVFGVETCINIPTVRTVPNEEYIARLKKYNDCIKNKIEQGAEGVKNTVQKVTKKINQLIGKARTGMQKLLKKAILKRVSASIRINMHGIATRLYPAIISENEAVRLRYKKSFISKAKSSYNEVLSEWIKLGGTRESLNASIVVGARKRIYRFKKSSPYVTQTSTGSNAPKKSSFDGGWSNWNSDYSSVMGPEEDEIPEDEIPEDSTPDPSTETLTAEEIDALDEQGAEETVDSEEKQKGFKAFIQRILAIFRKNKAEEIPYEEGTTEATNFNADTQADAGILPGGSDADAAKKIADVISGKSGDAGDENDNKILPKTVFWVGVGVVVLVGGYFAYKKWGK